MKNKFYFFLLLTFISFMQNTQAQIVGAGFTATATRGCGSLLTSFTATPADPTYTYQWLFSTAAGDSVSVVGNATVSQLYTFDPSSLCRTVTLHIIDATGHTATVTKPNYICVYSNPIVSFAPAPGAVTVACGNLCTQFIDQSVPSSGSSSIVSWKWSSGGGVPSMVGYPGSPIGAPGVPNPIFCYTVIGNYTVALTATDNNGCSQTYAQNSAVHVTAPPKASISSPVTNCSTPFTTSFNVSINTYGAAGVTAQINYGDSTAGVPNGFVSLPSTGGVVTHTYTSVGQYAVTVVATGQNGCADTTVLSQPIIVSAPLTFNFTPNHGCVGTTIDFTPQAGGTSLMWDLGDGGLVANVDPQHTYISPGTYYPILTATLPNGCRVTKVSDTPIIISSAPNAYFTFVTKRFCSLPATPMIDTFPLAPVGGTVIWDFGGTPIQTNPPVGIQPITQPGVRVMTVVVTDSIGCSQSHSDSIYIKPIKAGFALSRTKGCVPYTTALSITNAFNIPNGGGGMNGYADYPITSTKWYEDGSATPFLSTITPTEPPAYTFSSLTAPYLHTFKQVIVNSQGCRDSITHTIVGSDKPTAAFTFSPSTTCAQFPVLFDGNGGAPGASGCPINDVVWSFGDSTVSYSRSLTANHIYSDTALAFPNGCSRFKPWLFVESNGCRSDTAHNGCVIINPAIAKFTVEQNCSNRMCITLHATDNLLAENNSAGSSFDWQITNVANGGLISVPNAPNQQVCFQTTGQYLVTLTVSDINSGCTQSATKTITIANPVASMTTSAMSGCAPLLLQFASTSTDTLNIATYAWTFSGAPAGAAPIILYSGTSSSNQGYSLFTTPGLYTTPITLTITDVNGCAFSTTTPNNVDVRGLIVDFIATPTSACAPATINLTSTSISLPVGSTIANTYWDFGNNSAPTLYDATGPTAALQVATASTNWVKLVVVNSLGCRDSLTRLTAAVYGTSAIFNTDTLRCTNQNLAFQNTSFGQSALTYNWSFPGANITSSSNRVPVGINYPTEGYYTVCLTVSQNNPIVCSSSICQQVHIADPHIAFTADTTVSYCPPALISFTNQSTNCTAYTWHIRDDTGAEISVSNFANMQYVFTNQGNYTVVLYGTTTSGCRDSLVRTSYIHISGPGGAYSFTPSSGCAPLDVEFTAFNLIGTDQVAIYGGDFDCAQPLQIFPVTNTTAIIHHIYHCAGIYNPVLYVQNATGCNRIIDFQMPVTVDTVSGGHVHPGDTNNDGVANNLDLLPIALYTGATGPARSPQNTQWTQSCLNELPWSGYIQNTTTNLKHVDCDGNGTILPNDTLAILQNYGRTHARQPLVVYTNVPTISCVFPSDTARNVTYPYTLQSSINVGDAANPATNIAGLAFTINYDRTLADSAYMSLSNFSWLGAPNELYHLQHDDGQGHLDVAISRFDGTTRNGFGQVAICNFVITDNIIGRGITGLSYPFNVSVSGIKAIDNQNIDKPMNGAAMHTVFTNMILNTVENSLSQRVHIFPNPLTTHRLNIHTENLVCTAIQISTMLGQVIFSDVNINKSQFIVDLPTLSAGVYIVEMTTNGERVMKKLVVGNIK